MTNYWTDSWLFFWTSNTFGFLVKKTYSKIKDNVITIFVICTPDRVTLALDRLIPITANHARLYGHAKIPGLFKVGRVLSIAHKKIHNNSLKRRHCLSLFHCKNLFLCALSTLRPCTYIHLKRPIYRGSKEIVLHIHIYQRYWKC